jgi:hypothetical protein
MPILIPIQGDVETPFHTRVYVADMSLDTYNGRSNHANYAMDIRGRTKDTTAFSTDLTTSEVGEAIGTLDINKENQPTIVEGTIETIAGDSFLVMVDAVSEELATISRSAVARVESPITYYQINAEFKVNNVVLPIKSFSYKVPTGKLGSILNVDLLHATPNAVPAGASVEFAFTFKVGTTPARFVLFTKGKLQERTYSLAYATDVAGGKSANVLSVSIMDVISDKFGLSPRRPVTMYDPARIKYDEVFTRSDQQMRDSNHNPIQPIIEPIGGLSMMTVLQRAYSDVGGFGLMSTVPGNLPPSMSGIIGSYAADQKGCGFAGIVTNIQDFLVRRADFEIQGGWHDGAQPCVGMFNPNYSVHDNKLFILDMDIPLPAGMTAYTVPIWKHKSMGENITYRPDANAVVVTYQYSSNDPYEDATAQKQYREVFNDENKDQSEVMEGQPGYYLTNVRRWDRESYMSDNISAVLDTVPISSDTRTDQTVLFRFINNGVPTVSILRTLTTHEETIRYTYDGDYKTGHTREVKAALANGNNNFFHDFRTIEREVCKQYWLEDPNQPGVKFMWKSVIDIVGCCYYDENNKEKDAEGRIILRYLPALAAQRSGVLSDSFKLTDFMPIKTIKQEMTKMKGAQLDMEVTEIDHLNGTIHRTYTQPTIGGHANDQIATKNRQMLFVDEESVGQVGFRVPMSINAYELPRLRAIDLAQRTLYRLKHPLMSMPIEFNGVDIAVMQGSVIRGERRDGSHTANYFVTGYEYKGQNLGKVGHRISQSCEAVEITPST